MASLVGPRVEAASRRADALLGLRTRLRGDEHLERLGSDGLERSAGSPDAVEPVHVQLDRPLAAVHGVEVVTVVADHEALLGVWCALDPVTSVAKVNRDLARLPRGIPRIAEGNQRFTTRLEMTASWISSTSSRRGCSSVTDASSRASAALSLSAG
ncbi:hypothetical protein ACFPRL_32140 [Pseudoclavibacter helvolus]